MALHQPDQLYQWLESDGIVRSCEFRQRDAPAYTIGVTTPDASLRVTRDRENGPVRVVGEAEVDPELLVAFGEDESRRRFLGQLSAVVTSTDGRFAFLDGGGERCDMAELRRVRFENRVYPGAVTRHRLLGSVQDVASAVGHLELILQNFHSYDPPSRSRR